MGKPSVTFCNGVQAIQEVIVRIGFQQPARITMAGIAILIEKSGSMSKASQHLVFYRLMLIYFPI